jgi:undecaprenyl-diphosphatase
VGLLLEAALLGVVQGLTEFLPVSSSAHLILARTFFGWNSDRFGLPFDVACHVGTLTAILIYFRDDLRELLGGLPRLLSPGSDPAARRLWCIALATIPAVLVGGLLGDLIDAARTPVVIVVTLSVVGVLMSVAERVGAHQRTAESLTLPEIVAVGVAQACALIPGVSRSGATITMGLWLGLTRASAARFSFLLGVPAMLGAATLEGLKLLTAEAPMDATTLQVFVVGMVVSGVVGYITVTFFLRFLVNHTLDAFVAYRLGLAAVTVAWLVL